MRFSNLGLSALFLVCATPAFAQEETAPPEPITVSGSVALASDYRFRGVSQSDKEMAIQGGITITHESGFYVGAWGSNLAGWGTFGGANMELDLIGGYKTPIGGGTLDVGLTWYMYPGGADKTDFAEPYVKLSGTTGPVTLTAGVFYAPQQEALGNWWFTGADAVTGVYNDPGDKEDNLYLSGDAVAAIPNTPVSLRAHIGYSDGNPGLGPNGTSVAPTGTYWDWTLGADFTYKNLTLGVSYIDTDISRADGAYLLPNFSKGGTDPIADGAVVVSLTAAF
ncbi:MAG TPA: hypothetical protein DEP91_09440 [Sphingomonas bacterium]|jgi:uncharacterized protein (TIGR02001 family)|uniref:Porin n=1 Tax=Sphingomonas bacterium TaxID=1895847 RepID=A0A3D0WCM5_9SPHN|nr:hypothetical protein [Sphingomonas bacterium]